MSLKCAFLLNITALERIWDKSWEILIAFGFKFIVFSILFLNTLN